jgi:SAM-dependent MidA family methyltransferase
MTTDSLRHLDASLAPPGWPAPAPDELARSRELCALIHREIDAAGGAMSFTTFMERALYAPGLGYYSAPQPKFGAAGDFITAPELSPLFGRCVANQIAQVLNQLGRGDILEAGAGSGVLAAELLLALEALKHLPQRYFILELSAALRAQQQRTLEQRAPHLLERVHWLEELPAPGFRGVILANELLDAMPVARFRVSDKAIVEQYVCNDDTGFAWCERPVNPTVAARVAPLALGNDYVSEIGLHADAWVRSLSVRLEQGIMLLLDYGFPRAEFYHPQRMQGTLMCHYRHRAHSDPLILVGLQDITAHVDFTAVAEAGTEAGLALFGYTSQAAFLIGCGLTEMAVEYIDLHPQLEQAQSISKLTAPHEMGELFKVIALGRGVQAPLRGFIVQDRRSRL